MASFGKSTTGSNTNTSSGNKAVVSPATPASSGTVTAGHFRINIDSGSGNVDLVIYADSSGAPGALLATSDAVSVTNTTMAWVDFTFSGANQISVVSGTQYWVGASWADPGTPTFTYERDNTASQRDEQTTHDPNPFGTPSLTSGGPIAVYIDYTTASNADVSAAITAGKTVTAIGSGAVAAAITAGKTVTASNTYGVPGTDFDLHNWYITLPTNDGSGNAQTVDQPTLLTYADANFYLDASGYMVMNAPVNGYTTSGSSDTRTELREEQSGSNASWDMSTTTRSLTVSGYYDPTSITGGSSPTQTMIIGQIHSTGGTPPVYITVDYSTTPSRMRVFIDADGGVGNLVTGFAPTDRLAYKIAVDGSGNVNIYGCIGDQTSLPGTPGFTYPYTHFVESTGCYYKAGSYNKTDTGTGSSGQSIARIAYLSLVQGAVSDADVSAPVTAAKTVTATVTSPAAPSAAITVGKTVTATVTSPASVSAAITAGKTVTAASSMNTAVNATIAATSSVRASLPGVAILQNATSGVRLLLEIAWGADLTDLTGASWTWTDITSDLDVHDNGLVITVGRPDESQQTQASLLTALLDNTSGNYSLGPQSANYPNVRRSVPVRCRVSLDNGSTWTVKYQGNAVGFPPNWDVTGEYATVTLTASGPLRQINQGSANATSYYAQTIPTLTGSGQLFEGLQYYWNNENGNGNEGADGTTSCFPTVPSGIVVASDPRVLNAVASYVPHSALSSNLNSTAFPISGPIPANWDFQTGQSPKLPATPNTGHLTFRWLCAFTSLSGTQQQPLIYWQTSASSSLLWSIYWDNNGNLRVQNGTNSTADNNYAPGFVSFNANGNSWYMQVVMSTNGSASDVILTVTAYDGTTGSYTWTAAPGSTTGYLTYVDWIGPGDNDETPVSEAHMTVQNVAAATYPSGIVSFFQGNPGEALTDRITRIANQAGLAVTIVDDSVTETSASSSDFMGSQFFDTLANLLREAEATGVGALYDGLNNGLTYITRNKRLSQQPTMTVDVSASPSAVIMPFAPQHDDLAIVNQATVSRRNGGTYTYSDTTSDTNINAIGVYSNTVTVNPESDASLPYVAKWLVHLGTPPSQGYRYPTFSFELEKVPSLLSSWLACYPTCRVDVTNIDSARSQHPTGTIKNVLEGWTETITQHRWHVDANCTSWQLWNVVTLAADTGSTVDTVGRYEPDSSTVNTSAAAGATSLSVAFTGTRWVTTADTGGSDNFPFTVAINGWPVVVTNVTGTTSPQTFTVNALAHAVTAGNTITIYQNPVLGK